MSGPRGASGPPVLDVRALPSSARLRAPGDDGWEGALAAADRDRRDAARARLRRSLGGSRLPGLDSPASSEPTLVQLDAAVVGPGHVIPAVAVTDAVLRTRAVEVAAPGAGAPGPGEGGWQRASVVAAALAGPASIRIEGATDLVPWLAPLLDDVAAAFTARVEVALLAAGVAAGEVARVAPVPTLVVAGESGVGLRVGERVVAPIEPGQIAVVPAGAPLVVVGQGRWWAEVAVHRFGPADRDRFVAGAAGRHPAFRESIPWDPATVGVVEGSMFGRPDPLGWALAQLDLPALEQEAVEHWRARLRPALAPDVEGGLALLADPGRSTIAAPGGWVVVASLVDAADRVDGVAVAVADRLVQAPAEVVVGLARGVVPPELAPGLLRTGLLGPGGGSGA